MLKQKTIIGIDSTFFFAILSLISWAVYYIANNEINIEIVCLTLSFMPLVIVVLLSVKICNHYIYLTLYNYYTKYELSKEYKTYFKSLKKHCSEFYVTLSEVCEMCQEYNS